MLEEFDIFVSYRRADAERVHPLVESLRALGYRVFFDVESIRVGEAWKQRLEGAIRRSRALILCWSAAAKSSEYVQFEYTKAGALGKKVLPWLLDSTPLPGMLEIHGVSQENPAVAAEALTRDLGWSLTRRRWLAGSMMFAAVAAGPAIWLRVSAVPRRPFVFRGHVQDESGEAVPGATVRATGVTAETTAEGKFTLVLASDPGPVVSLNVSKPGYGIREIDADPAIPDFGIVLERRK